LKLDEAIKKLIDIKFCELKSKASWLEMTDLISYLDEVVLRKTKVKSLNDAAYYIMNIKVNRIAEFMSVNAILDKSDSMESDFLEIMKG
jgi:hypothetical protein